MIVLAPSALARSVPVPDSSATSVQPNILALSDLARSVPVPSSVSFEIDRHYYPASALASAPRAFVRTSGPSAPQPASSRIQSATEPHYFLVPTPVGSDPMSHLAVITGYAMSSSPNIDTFIKGCQLQMVAAPPSSVQHLATPYFQSLSSSGLPAAVGNPWSLETIWADVCRGGANIHP